MRLTAYEKQATKRIAKALGVTPDGLAVLGRAVANGGILSTTHGMASVKLEDQGYVIRHIENDALGQDRAWGTHIITAAGVDIVKRARAMGW